MAKKLIGFYKLTENNMDEFVKQTAESIHAAVMQVEKEKLLKKVKPKKCPSCGKSQVIPILYGMPAGPVDESKVWIGGCCVSDDSPKWHCKACGKDF